MKVELNFSLNEIDIGPAVPSTSSSPPPQVSPPRSPVLAPSSPPQPEPPKGNAASPPEEDIFVIDLNEKEKTPSRSLVDM